MTLNLPTRIEYLLLKDEETFGNIQDELKIFFLTNATGDLLKDDNKVPLFVIKRGEQFAHI